MNALTIPFKDERQVPNAVWIDEHREICLKILPLLPQLKDDQQGSFWLTLKDQRAVEVARYPHSNSIRVYVNSQKHFPNLTIFSAPKAQSPAYLTSLVFEYHPHNTLWTARVVETRETIYKLVDGQVHFKNGSVWVPLSFDTLFQGRGNKYYIEHE